MPDIINMGWNGQAGKTTLQALHWKLAEKIDLHVVIETLNMTSELIMTYWRSADSAGNSSMHCSVPALVSSASSILQIVGNISISKVIIHRMYLPKWIRDSQWHQPTYLRGGMEMSSKQGSRRACMDFASELSVMENFALFKFNHFCHMHARLEWVMYNQDEGRLQYMTDNIESLSGTLQITQDDKTDLCCHQWPISPAIAVLAFPN